MHPPHASAASTTLQVLLKCCIHQFGRLEGDEAAFQAAELDARNGIRSGLAA